MLKRKFQNQSQYQKILEKKNRNSNQRKSIRGSGRRSKSLGRSIEEDLSHLKTVVVSDNIDMIKSKLKTTAVKRLQLLKNKNFDFLENFSFFFTHPELVSVI